MDALNQITALFLKGGFVMYPLALCSLVVVAIAIDRYTLYRRLAASKADCAELESCLTTRNWSGLQTYCQNHAHLVSQILSYGLLHSTTPKQELQTLLENRALLLITPLKNRINYLETIITLAPLLGLLGTVTGMIQTFSILNLQVGQTPAITGGVGEALIATATGLCVATLALLIHSYLVQQLDHIIFSLEKAGSTFLEQLEQSPGDAP